MPAPMIRLFLIFLLYIFFVYSISFSDGDFFIQCDLNKDTNVDKFELEKCITNIDKLDLIDFENNKSNFKDLIMKMDRNNDEKISLNEYLEASKKDDDDDDDMLDIKNSDGSIKKMNKKVLFDSIEKNMKGMKMKDGKMMKDVEGSEAVNVIMKNNPQMGSFIKLGNYSLDFLKLTGHVKEGSLYRMKTISNDKSKIDYQVITFNKKFSVLIIII